MSLRFDAGDAERGRGCTGHLCCSFKNQHARVAPSLSSLSLFVLLEDGTEVSVKVLVTSWAVPGSGGSGLFPAAPLRRARAGSGCLGASLAPRARWFQTHLQPRSVNYRKPPGKGLAAGNAAAVLAVFSLESAGSWICSFLEQTKSYQLT